MRKTGSYLPGVNEKVVGTVNAFILTEDKVVHVRAKTSFVDMYVQYSLSLSLSLSLCIYYLYSDLKKSARQERNGLSRMQIARPIYQM